MDITDPFLERLSRLIEGIPVAMVTSVANRQMLRSRPMPLERLTPDGALIFLTHLSSHKVDEVRGDPHVNVAFIGSAGDRYISVSGVAEVAQDEARIRALWNPTYRAWFPKGPSDPDAGTLTVRIERVEYWDVPTSRAVRLWCAVRAIATGTPVEAGEHRTWTIEHFEHAPSEADSTIARPAPKAGR